jgi:hypothetical protein
MTPETIRVVSQLRHEFYSLFAAAMQIPVNITNEKSYASNLPTASWVDSRKRLNYVRVYAYIAPDDLVPDRPFILRVAVNKGADVIAAARRGKSFDGLNRSWQFELTLLPEEVLDFLPWIVSLVKFYDRGSSSVMPEPPYPIDFRTSEKSFSHNAWTDRANNRLAQQLLPSQGHLPCLNTSLTKLLR